MIKRAWLHFCCNPKSTVCKQFIATGVCVCEHCSGFTREHLFTNDAFISDLLYKTTQAMLEHSLSKIIFRQNVNDMVALYSVIQYTINPLTTHNTTDCMTNKLKHSFCSIYATLYFQISKGHPLLLWANHEHSSE